MKGRVLSLLKEKYPDYISGEEISRLLGVSRTAVWKHIQGLRQDGYEIESSSKVGYCLVRSPDRLYEHEIAPRLKTQLIGSTTVHRDSTGSTNELAKELAQKGAVDGTVVIAEEQTRGKGRLGRDWHSPAGRGLWFSVILRPQISPANAAKLTLVCAVAVARAIREMTGLMAGIKWPNDILISGHKVCGILTEMNAEIERVNYLIVGIGVNTDLVRADLPDELREAATSLSQELGGPVSRINLLTGILHNFDSLYRDYLDGAFPAILTEWKTMSVTLNRWVKIISLGGEEEGIAFDIDDEGALLLMKKDGSMKRVISGEVSLR